MAGQLDVPLPLRATRFAKATLASSHTALRAGCVISLAAAALWLVHWGRALPRKVSLIISNTLKRISAVEKNVAKALAALALERTLRGDVHLNQDSQATQLSQKHL